MEETKVVDIDRLAGIVAGRARIDGVVHDVLKAKGRTIQSIRAARGSDSSAAMFDAVRKCVPSLPEGAEFDLTMEQATAIFGIATAGVAAVEAMFPNVLRPDADPTSPA
jgi:hypothetical protein